MLNGLDLFSGIGGLSIALAQWVRVQAYCERDPYAQGVLLSRMSTGELDRAPIATDICELHAYHLPKEIDIIYGGFPCQDISAAGHGVGLGGERSGLFQHIARLVEETNPRFVFLENVPAIRTRGLNGVAQTFTELGYDCRWTVVSAKEIGANHWRKRWFLLAHASNDGTGRRLKLAESNAQKASAAANIDSSRGKSRSGAFLKTAGGGELVDNPWTSPEPYMGRMVHGVPFAVDRIRGLGNACIPLQAKTAFMRLLDLKEPATQAKDDK